MYILGWIITRPPWKSTLVVRQIEDFTLKFWIVQIGKRDVSSQKKPLTLKYEKFTRFQLLTTITITTTPLSVGSLYPGFSLRGVWEELDCQKGEKDLVYNNSSQCVSCLREVWKNLDDQKVKKDLTYNNFSQCESRLHGVGKCELRLHGVGKI